jgi:hypothetical protein
MQLVGYLQKVVGGRCFHFDGHETSCCCVGRSDRWECVWLGRIEGGESR